MKIKFTKKLRADKTQGILATILFRVCLLVSSINVYNMWTDTTPQQILLLYSNVWSLLL